MGKNRLCRNQKKKKKLGKDEYRWVKRKVETIWNTQQYNYHLLKKNPENPLDSKEIKPVSLRGDQPWISTGILTDAEAEAPVFHSSDMNRWLIGKVLDAGKDLRAEGEEGGRGWDAWTASPMKCTWTWEKSRRLWGAGRPGVLQSTGSKKSHTWLGNWTTTTQLPHWYLPGQFVHGLRSLLKGFSTWCVYIFELTSPITPTSSQLHN